MKHQWKKFVYTSDLFVFHTFLLEAVAGRVDDSLSIYMEFVMYLFVFQIG